MRTGCERTFASRNLEPFYEKLNGKIASILERAKKEDQFSTEQVQFIETRLTRVEQEIWQQSHQGVLKRVFVGIASESDNRPLEETVAPFLARQFQASPVPVAEADTGPFYEYFPTEFKELWLVKVTYPEDWGTSVAYNLVGADHKV